MVGQILENHRINTNGIHVRNAKPAQYSNKAMKRGSDESDGE